MATWTVGRTEDGPWEIRHDGHTVNTIPGHYDAWEVLAITEREAGTLAWLLQPGGDFTGTTTPTTPAPGTLTIAQADHLAQLASKALLASSERGTAIAKGDQLPTAEDEATYEAFQATTRALYEAIHALEHR